MRQRRFGRLGLGLSTAVLGLFLAVTPTLACGGLIGPNGAVNLLRTTTLAGYHDGVEHYVTAFQFAGGGGAFGWLIRETEPIQEFDSVRAAPVAAASAVELMKVKIDALDLTVLKGGAADIGVWAKDHGFRLPPDAPEVLDFYAARSQIFLAAAFDADAARNRGQQVGDGTPVHITIPTANPWVPLRILALGKAAPELVQADVYLLTDRAPALLPVPTGENGIRLDHSAAATDSLLADLRTDRGMEWVPSRGWLTKVGVDGTAGQLGYDLAAPGIARPQPAAAGPGVRGCGPRRGRIDEPGAAVGRPSDRLVVRRWAADGRRPASGSGWRSPS